MPKYNIHMETRKEGAIGVFQIDIFTITASTEAEAKDKALRSARTVHGLEPRSILKVEEVEA